MDQNQIKKDFKRIMKNPVVREFSRLLIDEGINYLSKLRRTFHDANSNQLKQFDRKM